jgi:hypothetical protein
MAQLSRNRVSWVPSDDPGSATSEVSQLHSDAAYKVRIRRWMEV